MDVRGRRAAVARGFASVRRSTAGPFEVGAVVVLAIGVWRLALGWNWTPTGGERARSSVAQAPEDWLALAIVAVLAVGWLAARGRPVSGFLAVCVPVVVLSGWRLVAGNVLDWPTELATLVFGLSATCMPAALVGWWLRRRTGVVDAHRDGIGDGPPAQRDGTSDDGAVEPDKAADGARAESDDIVDGAAAAPDDTVNGAAGPADD